MSHSSPLLYDYVWRWKGPNYGRKCAIVALSKVGRDVNGTPVHNVGDECIALEFEDGTRVMAMRQQVLSLAGKQARQIVSKAARGGMRIGEWRALEARKAAR